MRLFKSRNRQETTHNHMPLVIFKCSMTCYMCNGNHTLLLLACLPQLQITRTDYNKHTHDTCLSFTGAFNTFEVIYQTRATAFHRDIQTLRSRVENTTCSGVFLTKFKVFGYLMKHCLECLIYLHNRNKN